LQQTQLTIQGDLAALQAALSKGGLPIDQGSSQEAATSNQEAVLANTESLLDVMEVRRFPAGSLYTVPQL